MFVVLPLWQLVVGFVGCVLSELVSAAVNPT